MVLVVQLCGSIAFDELISCSYPSDLILLDRSVVCGSFLSPLWMNRVDRYVGCL